MCIKLERLNDCAKDALKTFMDFEYNDLVNSNITDNKLKLKALNKNLQKELQLEDDLINKLYTSKYVQHFYTKEEIHIFRQRWAKKG